MGDDAAVHLSHRAGSQRGRVAGMRWPAREDGGRRRREAVALLVWVGGSAAMGEMGSSLRWVAHWTGGGGYLGACGWMSWVWTAQIVIREMQVSLARHRGNYVPKFRFIPTKGAHGIIAVKRCT
jgi:hypothetical protein